MDQGKACRFCEDFERERKEDRKTEDEVKARPERAFDLDHKYKACLQAETIRIWRDGDTPKRTHAGKHISQGYKLRFCPECGKRIQGKGKRS